MVLDFAIMVFASPLVLRGCIGRSVASRSVACEPMPHEPRDIGDLLRGEFMSAQPTDKIGTQLQLPEPDLEQLLALGAG